MRSGSPRSRHTPTTGDHRNSKQPVSNNPKILNNFLIRVNSLLFMLIRINFKGNFSLAAPMSL